MDKSCRRPTTRLLDLSRHSYMDLCSLRGSRVPTHATRSEFDFIQEQTVAPIQWDEGKRVTLAYTCLVELHNLDSICLIEAQGHLPRATATEPEILWRSERRG